MVAQKFASFVGFGKESTPGTGVVPTTFIPVTDQTPENVVNYVPDTANRGSVVAAYGQIPTQQWSTYGLGGPVYLDSIGLLLKSILGDETLTGAGPYTHAMSVLNTSPFQPPAYSITDYNGVQAKRYPFSMCSQLEFSFGADALLSWSATFQSFPSTNVSTPTKSYGTKVAQAAYKAAVTIGGVASTRTVAATITLTRNVGPIIALNNSTSPAAINSGAFAVSGSITNLYNDDTDLAALTAGTAQSLDITLTDSVTTDSLQLHMTSDLFLTGPIDRGQDWLQVPLGLGPVANTTDAGASGGYSPLKATLVNTVATAY